MLSFWRELQHVCICHAVTFLPNERQDFHLHSNINQCSVSNSHWKLHLEEVLYGTNSFVY